MAKQPSRSSGASKSRSTRSTGTRTATRKAPPPPPTATERATAFAGKALGGHGADIAGLALIALGIIAGLGIYGDLVGPAGGFLSDATGAFLGLVRWLTPPVLVLLGVVVLRSGPHAEDDPTADAGAGDRPHDQAARLIVGCALLLISVTGLLHLVAGSPEWGDPVADFGDAGGYLGFATGAPLEAVLAVWGAALVLITVGLVGVIVLSRAHVRTAADRTAAGVRPAGSALRQAYQWLFRVGDDRSGAPAAASGSATLFDQDEGAALEPVAPKKALRPAKKRAIEPALEPIESTAREIGPPRAVKGSPWKLPPANLLERAGDHEYDHAQVEATGRELERALAEHGVETRLVGMVVGPTVTRFELELGPGVKVARVTSLHKDIAYAMASPDVRILAPIPGRQAIGVEVPNVRRHLVSVGDILASPEARKATHPLEVAVGRDIAGKAVLANLATMPHILIAGATGAGKSSCINSIITSILMRSTPEQVRMILVDPKQVELGQYERLPHLLTQVVTDPKKAANALAWACKEMDRRYDLLSEAGVRDITGYNAKFDRGELRQGPPPGEGADGDELPAQERMPFILVVVDELNDLMMVAARDVEASITRIAQKARAVGIHLVVATQRPSVNVITGVIKANIPARLAFAVASLQDSRVILDQPGAERLVGKGDMLLLGPTSSVPHRIQGSWVTEEEVRGVVKAWHDQAPDVAYVPGVDGEADPTEGGGGAFGGGDSEDDELLRQAMDLVVRSQLGSTSMLQRKLRVGFARAGRLMDLLEQQGVVGPSEGSKSRAVLMTVEELDGLG
ncbi:MAG: DNA translocase FtsK 4TM domain-containing protein [Acidimicrobiales bacterium]|nr:DNA translocase FtsK 4TM domain-containing protein [Acidimicrobiales bacterium]